MTEDSDALAVVVSEETGQISVAHNGRLIRNLDQDRLRRVLRTLMRLDKPAGAAGANGKINFPGRSQIERRTQPLVKRKGATPTKGGPPQP